MPDLHRRELMRTGAALFATTGVVGAAKAGEFGSNGGRSDAIGRRLQDGDVPSYAGWIPHPDEGATAESFRSVFSVGIDALLMPSEDSGEEEDRLEDPMVVNPAVAALVSAFSWWGLQETGLDGPILGPAAEEENPDPGAVPADRHLFVGQTEVFLGSFDHAALEDAVTGGDFAETDVDGIYAHGQQDLVVTWTDGAVILGPDADHVETVVAVGTGSIDPRHEIDPDFEWLLRTAGHGDFTVAVLSDDETVDLEEGGDNSDADFSMFEGSKGYAQSVAFETPDRVTATTAVLYASEDRVDRDRLESNLGTGADDRTVEQDGRNVTLDASYSAPTNDDGEETETEDGGTETEDGGTDDGTDGGTETDDGSDDEDDGDESDDGTADGDSETDESTEETDESGDDSAEDADATEDDEGATEDGTGSTETGDGADGGGDESDDDSLPGPGILGALSSVGGVGYLLSRRLTDDE